MRVNGRAMIKRLRGDALTDGAPRARATLQGRIAAAALGTAVAVMILASAVFVLERFEEDAGREVVAQTALTRTLVRMIAPTGDLSALADMPEVRAARLYDRKGRLRAHYVANGEAASAVRTTRAAAPGGGALEIDETPLRVEVIAAQYLAMIGALFFAATGVALFLGQWLARRVAAPIQSLSAAMGLVAQNADFSLRVPVSADDELGRLIESFNHLLAELQVKRRELDLTMTELVEAKDAAEAANRLKTQFLANMSHEIRTPLNGVLAMTQLMLVEAADPMQRERLLIVQQSGEALLAILNDILDVAKIESGFVTIERAPFELRALARAAAAPFAEMATAKGLGFVCEVADAVPHWLMGDQGKLRQVLGNLASNAVKFTDEGQIRLTVEVSPEAPDRLRIEVADTGIGVDPDKIDLLFRKFSQVDSSNTRRFGGAGLGLAICKELVERMGGRIWMESETGAGARVLIDLPAPAVEAPADAALSKLVEPASPSADVETGVESDVRALRVLAAEDNPTNQRVLRAVLDSLAVDLTLVGDGRAAVEAMDQDGFDLILMDIQMPEMDGVAATREIRRREALAGRPRTPIVAVSANAMPFQVEEYLAAGMDAHLAKPIDVARLYALLSGGLGDYQPQAEHIDAA